MKIIDLLQKIDLSPSESKTYLNVLEKGETKSSEVGKLIGTTRVAGYNAVFSLLKKGLLVYSNQAGIKKVIAENPERLLSILSEKQKQLRNERRGIEEILPELKSFYTSAQVKPDFRLYQGVEGLKAIFDDVVRSTQRGEGYSAYATMREELGELHPYFEDFKESCRKKRIKFRAIVPVESERYYRGVKVEHRDDFAYIPNWKFPFVNEVFIYKNKMAIMSFKDKIGVILESKQIAETQKLIFELAWFGALEIAKHRNDPV